MSLRFKLLIVALSTLVLPWVGWQFVRQTEGLLRQGQEQTLRASAEAVVKAVDALGVAAPVEGPVFPVFRARQPMVVDGYADDWDGLLAYRQPAGSGEQARAQVLLAEDAGWLHLLVEVRDGTRARVDARDRRVATSDHVVLELQRGPEQARYRLASAAPGEFDAPAGQPVRELPDHIAGQWQEDGSSYRVELRLPRAILPDRIAVAMHDSAAPGQPDAPLRRLVRYDADAARVLAQLAPDRTQARLVTPEGWLTAEGGGLVAEAADAREDEGWFGGLIYRGLIAPALTGSRALDDAAPRLDVPEVRAAAGGQPSLSWRPGARPGEVVLAAAVPRRQGDRVTGVLVLEQASRALPLLANRALTELMVASAIALAVAGGVLVLFGAVLSFRIRRLRNAAEQAVGSGGRLAGPLPLVDSRDELGDLARSFGKLLQEVDAYTDYLRTLASKLSHELNTPLAIVKSSLDNLDQHPLGDGARAYLARARDGAERLGTIVRAMSESHRIERAIASAEAEDFDLDGLVAGCAAGYRALAGTRTIRLQVPEGAFPFHGAPELIAQALDKLFDNARSFTPEDGWIGLYLAREGEDAVLTVANSGSRLPEALQERLFDTLVSVRERSSRGAGETPHLGLGLYVVRLVADLHRGQASARNRAEGDGVEFVLRLKGMPRRRLAAGD
ncbi:ATP-binding protein [Dokdonella koreensis]|uniref:histidine kinase n=1 Tax=Dokdonella koreensis DS-123 TaxID=1300342 RepID=A0A167GTX8_9GAMM|nr:ATP-binding protein [Dokdonella koreensis]ANB17606.1 Signal transduction histidine kinase [Dokdonella koreensis DS-123]